jgi:hypothetical protein
MIRTLEQDEGRSCYAPDPPVRCYRYRVVGRRRLTASSTVITHGEGPGDLALPEDDILYGWVHPI